MRRYILSLTVPLATTGRPSFRVQSSLPTYSKTLLENPGLVYASHEAKRLALNLEHEKRAVLACKRDFRCAASAPRPLLPNTSARQPRNRLAFWRDALKLVGSVLSFASRLPKLVACTAD